MLEKAFGKLKQGSGGSYFITAQQDTENFRIKQTKLQISLHCDLHISAVIIKCSNCEHDWTPMLQLFLTHFLILKTLSVKKLKQI